MKLGMRTIWIILFISNVPLLHAFENSYKEVHRDIISSCYSTSAPEKPSPRRKLGCQTYYEVYGDSALLPSDGTGYLFKKIIIDQHFSEIWSRKGLSIPSRRLLTIGVLTEKGMFDIIQFQFERSLEVGELTPEQIQEIVVHLVAYSGATVSGGLNNAAIKAIENFKLRTDTN